MPEHWIVTKTKDAWRAWRDWSADGSGLQIGVPLGPTETRCTSCQAIVSIWHTYSDGQRWCSPCKEKHGR